MIRFDQLADPRKAFAWLLLAAVAAGPYLLTMNFPLAYDDHGQLVENAFLRNPESVSQVLSLQTLGDPAVINGRRPVVLLSYFVDAHLLGGSTAAFHITNAVMHLAVCITLFLLLARLTACVNPKGSALAPAWAAAMLFGAHPLVSEAVHLPSFRPDMLYTVFVLLGLRVGISFVERYSFSWLWRVMAYSGLAALALLSKEAGIILPILLAVCWWIFPSVRPRAGTQALLLGISGIMFAGYMILCMGGAPIQTAGSSWNGISLRFPENLLTGPWLLVLYLRYLLIPMGLSLDHSVPAVTGAGDWRLYAGLALLAGLAVLGFRLRKSRPLAAFGLAMLLVGFAPVSNLLPLINPFAERYAYFLVIAGAVLLLGIAHRVTTETAAPWVYGITAVFLALGGMRLYEWRSQEAIWEITLKRNPESVKAMTWLGTLERPYDRKKAEALFLEAYRLNPQAASDAMVNLAVMKGERGDLSGAEEILREAIARRPEKPAAYKNLGFDLELQGRYDESLDVLRKGLSVDPHYLPTRLLLAESLANKGLIDEAAAVTLGTLQLDPANAAARNLMLVLRGKQ